MSQIVKTDPDQNNSNGKLKYFSNTRAFEQPLFRFYNSDVVFNRTKSNLYRPNGKLELNLDIDTNTKYTRNIMEQSQKTPVSDFDSKYFPSFVSNINTNINTKINTNVLFGTSGDPLDRSKKIGIESEFKIPEYSRTGKLKDVNNREYSQVNDRRRNLDHSSYIPTGSMTNTGFGNINDFSKIKYGESTRDILGPSRDKEQDRFHFTYRNYQHQVYGSNPNPQDTRYLNKKF